MKLLWGGSRNIEYLYVAALIPDKKGTYNLIVDGRLIASNMKNRQEAAKHIRNVLNIAKDFDPQMEFDL